MELSAKYDPKQVEDKWYRYWEEHKCFHSEPDEREPYTIVIPPPNVTGVLHMGHMLNNTIQDVLVRRARMQGKNACWVPGTDHASIATESKVVKRLAEQGIRKRDLSREEFLKHAWDWTHEHGGLILKKLRRLGASCDWDRTGFTMDEVRSASVIKVFVDLYNKGLIYRGLRMVNWDPKALTALSNEEVIYREEASHLYNLKYYVAPECDCSEWDSYPVNDPEHAGGNVLHRDEKGYYAVVATTRPETIMGDTAMCINPKDPKNRWLSGKKVIVPLVGRVIPVIEDRYVEIEFGTGCLKVTPAHDTNDYMLGKTHNLESIDIFNPDATVSEQSPLYVGMDRFACRKQIVKDLQAAGLMEKVEDYTNKVGYSERNPDTAIEPRLSLQWFLKMKHFADMALPPVMEDRLKFYPPKYKATYHNWLDGIQDWCISRQLWWGHRIPAYYWNEEEFVVAETLQEAVELARKASGNAALKAEDLHQDEDALDTWFSSWLWPVSLFDGLGKPGNEEIKYYYPTTDLVTAPDIIFFWVARMIMAGYEYMGEMPFKNVYFTGLVRDKLGRKMSKSLGNSPDALKLLDDYGADGVRIGMLLCTSAGSDILFDESQVEQGRNFCNKIWNSFRLLKGWSVDEAAPQGEAAAAAVKWFDAKLSRTIATVDDHFSKFRISDALMTLYKFFWDDFCAWYLEIIKPEYGKPIDGATYSATLRFFDALLKLIHPIMPFITEELWQGLEERKDGETIMLELQPKAGEWSDEEIERFEMALQTASGVRGVRQSKNISPRETVDVLIKGDYPKESVCVAVKLANLGQVQFVDAIENPEAGVSFLVGRCEVFVSLSGMIDVASEMAKIEAEIARYEKFLAGVKAKLGNERFVANAPEAVVAVERKKEADAASKLESLRASLAALKK